MLISPLSQIVKPTLAQIAALGGSYLRHPRYQGCVGRWLMGEGGGITLYDISEVNNSGDLTDFDTETAWSVGQFGTTLDFDGADDHVLLNAAPLTGTQHKAGWTFMGWFNAEVIDTGNNILMENGDSDWTILRINVINTGGNNKLRVFNRDNNPGSEGFVFDTTTNIVAGIWYHFALTYDGAGNWKLYLDGLLNNTHTKNISGTYNMNGGAIGARPSGISVGNEPFDGLLDDFRTFDREYNANEILSVFLNPFLEFEPDDAEERSLSFVPSTPVIQSRISIGQP